MAGITSTGLVSGLDIESLVAGLVQSEGAPQANRILRQETSTKAQISALGTMKAVFSGLKTALTTLGDGTAFAARTAKSSDDKVFTASAGAKSVAGTYEIEVRAKATAHKLASQPVATADTAVGSGKLTISVGADSFEVTLDDEHKSLANIRDAINSSSSNKGVTATIIKSDTGSRLVLTANDTGTAKAVKVAASGGDGGLSVLDYDPNGTKNLTELNPALDAEIVIDGYKRTSSSNKITDAIDGVSIDIVAAEKDVVKKLTVTRDDAAARKAIDGFVTAYNTAIAAMATVTKYDATAKTAAALNGDAMVRNAQQSLRNIIGGDVAGLSDAMNSLAEIGITSQKDGTLSADGAKVDAALANNGTTVKALFANAGGGLGKKLAEMVDNLVGETGSITTRTDALNKRTTDLANQRSALESRLAGVETRYRTQFTALETLMAKMSSTSTFLSQQLARL